MTDKSIVERISHELRALGILSDDVILVHSSLKSLGYVEGGTETVIRGLLEAIGDNGTLLMPALSYSQKPPDVHINRETPSNVGFVPEYFRKREGTIRSLHPTHSVCGIGNNVSEILKSHHLDNTPCGPNSPFNRIIDYGAKIVMLGCELRPNTTMHALEEYKNPPYLFGEDCVYTITDRDGKTYKKKYRRHGFSGWKQRYDRVAQLSSSDSFIRSGNILEAQTFVLDSQGFKIAVLSKLQENPCFFVDRY